MMVEESSQITFKQPVILINLAKETLSGMRADEL